MADATAIINRYPNFPKRKSLDLSQLTTSTQSSLRKRPQNLGLKSMTMKDSIEGTFPKRECLKICETDSSIEYDKRGPSEIRPFLFLGSQEHASKLKTLRDFKIDAILNVTREVVNFFPTEFEYHNCPVTDETSTDIFTIFESCFSFIEKIRRSKRRVLVHCYAGVSRSTTICVAYLMRMERMAYKEAIDWVQKCRPVVAPNLGFLGQLLDYERSLQKPVRHRTMDSFPTRIHSKTKSPALEKVKFLFPDRLSFFST